MNILQQLIPKIGELVTTTSEKDSQYHSVSNELLSLRRTLSVNIREVKATLSDRSDIRSVYVLLEYFL